MYSFQLGLFVHRYRLAILGVIFGVGLILASALMLLAQPQPTKAATTCPQSSTPPQFNVMFCGLSGNTAADYISSFKNAYNSNNDGHGHTDLQAVYAWAGANASMVASMDTSDTMLGTVYSNGVITVNGQTVGNNAQIAGRWNNHGASGFTFIEGDVWSRAATTYLSNTPQVQVLVHFNPSGQADFAVMTPCGNAVQLTPTTPPKTLTCDSLTATQVDSTLEYTFTAKATPQNTTITSYTFDFGDGNQKTINTGDKTVSTPHTYAQSGQAFTARVTVNGSVTSNNCMTQIVTRQQVKDLTCDLLTAAKADTTGARFTFTAKATPQNTTITSYLFDFGDGSQPVPVATGNTMANTTHTYSNPGNYTATVSVSSTDKKNITSTGCSTQVSVATQPQLLSATTSQPTLPNTGAGDVIGLFGISSIAGGLFHGFLTRRKVLN